MKKHSSSLLVPNEPGTNFPRLARRHFIVTGSLALAWRAKSGFAAEPLVSNNGRRVLVLGDSLSAEYGLRRGQGWVAKLSQRLKPFAPDVTLVNASISGDTTAGGKNRLPALLRLHRPSHLIIELGGNDALRGFPLQSTKDNLDAMVSMARAQGAHVMLVGMQIPPNYGRQYASDFAALFEGVAKKHAQVHVPFLLAGVADAPNARQWFQADGIHPTEAAQSRMVDNVWVVLKPWLKLGKA